MSTISYLVKTYRTKASALFGILCLIFSRPTPDSLMFGLVFIVLGQGIRIWSSGHIHKNEVLTVTGPYSLSRNPLYAGSFIMGVGFVIAIGVLWIALSFLVFFSVVYTYTIRWEEEKLVSRFPDGWQDYQRSVPRFLPTTKLPDYRPGEYSWMQVRRHKEVQHLSVVLLMYLLLWGKAYLAGG